MLLIGITSKHSLSMAYRMVPNFIKCYSIKHSNSTCMLLLLLPESPPRREGSRSRYGMYGMVWYDMVCPVTSLTSGFMSLIELTLSNEVDCGK